MAAPEFKYIEVVEIKDTGKTKVFNVINKLHRDELGKICWYAPWRRYTFITSTNALVFDAVCLDNIKEYINYLTRFRKDGST